jgi:ribonucleoside-diphosphate reductase alpha chain
MIVVKRNGETQKIAIAKIHKAVEWACQGLDVSLSEIETNAHIQFFDGIKTAQIHTALVNSAASLIDVGKTDYEFAAARLLLQQIYKEVTQDIIYPTLTDYISNAISLDKIKPEMQLFDLEVLNSAIDVSRDDLFKYLGMQTVYDRYLLRDEHQKLIEMPQHFWMRVAMGIALNETLETRTSWAIEFYNVLSKFEFVSSTPTLFNSGTKFSQMSSCFVTTTDDSIWEEQEGVNFGKGIFATMTECALYSKFAGGIGTDWTRVRPAGAGIGSTHGMSSGVVPYLKVFNDTAVSVNQCFDSETRIFTKSGFKAIKNIVVGDMVLGVRGDFNAVYDLRDYDQKEAMLEIDVKHSIDTLKVTDAHPIYAIQGANLETSISDTLNALEKGKLNADWVEAKNLKVSDYVAQPIPKMVCPIENFTDDDARMYGIMLGDGHISNGKNECGISLGIENKQNTISFVRNYLNIRGVNYWESVQNESCVHINFSGKNKEDCKRDENGRFVNDDSFINLPFNREHLYNEDGKKRIHETMMFLPESQTIALIKGLIETDGNISRGKEVTFCSTSLQLVEGLRLLLLRLECPSAVNIKEVTGRTIRGIEITDTTAYSVRIPMIEKLAKALDVPALTKFNWLVHNGCVFSRIKEITSVEPSAVVYDLKVDADHSYTTSACVVHNGGKRNGSFAAYLEPWHGDIERFINLKKPNGDERLRAREIFPYIWANDLFMKRVKAREKWSLFCSHKNAELCETYGEEFEKNYTLAEERGDAIKVIDAMELWKGIITALVESGAPLITFKDEHNRRNPQNHDGIIRSSNLCVTGNQRVVTSNGIFTAKELYENGGDNLVSGLTEISKSSPMRLIAENATVVRINTVEGYSHDVTPEHKVWVTKKGWVEARNLVVGDDLVTQQQFQYGNIDEPELALIAGLVASDGNFHSQKTNVVRIDIVENKTAHLKNEIIAASVVVLEKYPQRLMTNGTTELEWKETTHGFRLNTAALGNVLNQFGVTKETKLRVPEFVWKGTKQTIGEYLRGVFLGDGSVTCSSNKGTIRLHSVDSIFLSQIQILMASVGVWCWTRQCKKERLQVFQNGTYNCKAGYELRVSNADGIEKFNTLIGIVESRALFRDGAKKLLIKMKETAAVNREQSGTAKFTGLTSLPNEDVYCLTVNSETHAWTVNGLITHNCSEISLNTSDIESSVCNLGSINVSVCTQADFPRVIPTAMRMLDNVIDLNFYPTEKARRSNLKHRPVGLGLMGWTDYIISQGIDWESDEHLRLTDFVFEDFSYWAIKSSVEIAKEKGRYTSYDGSKWSHGILPIDTARKLPDEWRHGSRDAQSWDELRAEIQQHGMRNSNCMAIAPTATIANIVGTTPCIEPIYKQVFVKENKSGKFKVVDPAMRHNRPELCKTAFEIDQEWLIKAAAVRQKYIDQSQSVNLFKKANVKGNVISNWYFLAWELGLKSTYYLKQQISELSYEDVIKEDDSPALLCSIDNSECEACQ